MSKKISILAIVIAFLYVNTNAKNVSPLDFGLCEATNGEERFYALYRTHLYAIEHNEGVDYKGIKQLEITIPEKSTPIPLAVYNDFRGVTIIAESPYRDYALFNMNSVQNPIDIKDEDLDGDDFTNYEQLCRGTKLLIYEDQNPWVKKRNGFDYGATRKDVRLVVDGIAKNKTVLPYNNKPNSIAKCYYIISDEKQKTIKNLSIIRATTSKCKVYCFSINGQNNVLLKNISLSTPEPLDRYGDAAFSIKNSTNIRFEKVSINGTYSQATKYGYGIAMDNVWNSSFYKLSANANWGVFGNYNVQKCIIDNCDINRFDIHCYGKDVYMSHSVFRDNYSQFSSVYGIVTYDNCTFLNYIPCLIESSFNAHVPFDLIINKSKMYVDNEDTRNYLIDMGLLDTTINERRELTDKYWPNIKINGLDVYLPEDICSFHLFHVHNSIKNQKPIMLDSVHISNIFFKNNVKFKMCNHDVYSKTKPFVEIHQKAKSKAKVENNETISPFRSNPPVAATLSCFFILCIVCIMTKLIKS